MNIFKFPYQKHRPAETTATNPQFRIRVPPGHPAKAHVVVAVAQKYECYRSRQHEDGHIGFTIYEVPPGMPRVTPQYVSDQQPLDCAELQQIREVATFFALPPGDFVVLPHAQPHREGKFLLRILADQHADVWEVNDDNCVVHTIGAGGEFGVATASSMGGGGGGGGSSAAERTMADDRTGDCVCGERFR